MSALLRASLLLGILIFISQHLFGIEYNETKHRINNFLIDYFELNRNDNNSSFSFVSIDLNQDLKKEQLVALYGMNFCGSGGCTMLILNSDFTLNSHITLVQFPVYVSEKDFSEGWKNIYISKRNGKYALMQSNGNAYSRTPSVTKEYPKIHCNEHLTYNESDKIQFEYSDSNIKNNDGDCRPELENEYKSASQSEDKSIDPSYSSWRFLPYAIIILLLAVILLLRKRSRLNNDQDEQNTHDEEVKIGKKMNPWLRVSLLTFSLLFILILFIIISAAIGSSLTGECISSDLFPTYEHPLRAGLTSLIIPLLGIFTSVWIIQIKYHYKLKYYLPFIIFMVIFYPFYFLAIAFIYW